MGCGTSTVLYLSFGAGRSVGISALIIKSEGENTSKVSTALNNYDIILSSFTVSLTHLTDAPTLSLIM